MLLLGIFEILAYCSKVISVIHNMTINNCYQGCYCNQYFHHNYVCAQDNLNISRGQCGHGRGDTSYTAAAAISYRSISNSHCSYLPRQEGHLRLPHTLSLMFKLHFFSHNGPDMKLPPINIDYSSLINKGDFSHRLKVTCKAVTPH